jgi:hypothetical protein
MPKLTRWYYSQGRNETIYAINNLIDVSIEQFFLYKKLNNIVETNKYFNLLENCKIGLSNLKITYSTDSDIIQEIDKILGKINDFTCSNSFL